MGIKNKKKKTTFTEEEIQLAQKHHDLCCNRLLQLNLAFIETGATFSHMDNSQGDLLPGLLNNDIKAMDKVVDTYSESLKSMLLEQGLE